MCEPHLIEIIGDKEGEDETERSADDEVEEGVLEGDPEDRILQNTPEVLEADEASRRQQVPLRESAA
jgi:hypothetical protein